MTRFLAILAAALLVLGLAACSSSSKKSSGATSSAQITIQGTAFASVAAVKAGSTVTVQNKDSFDHTVTGDKGEFDITVPGGSTKTFTAPATAGSYAFHCKIHTFMHATLQV